MSVLEQLENGELVDVPLPHHVRLHAVPSRPQLPSFLETEEDDDEEKQDIPPPPPPEINSTTFVTKTTPNISLSPLHILKPVDATLPILSLSESRKRIQRTLSKSSTTTPNFSLNNNEEDDEVVETSQSKQIKYENVANFIEKKCREFGWTGERGRGPPTNNPFFLLSICVNNRNPFAAKYLHLYSPSQLGVALETVYCSPSSLHHSLYFHPRPGDIIVNGVFQSGQTPILHALACLKHGKIIPKANLIDCINWIETGRSLTDDPPFYRGDSGNRLIKTHLPLRAAFGGVVHPSPRGARPEYLVIVVLRNPLDVRLSWFRHLRRVCRKFNPNENFDSHFNLDDFVNVPLYAANPNSSLVVDQNLDYENFVAEAIKPFFDYVNTSQLLVVCYEELLINPFVFVDRLAEFTGLCQDDTSFRQAVAQTLYDDVCFPDNFYSQPNHSKTRRGSSNQGKQFFSPKSIQKLDARWKTNVCKLNLNRFPNYESLLQTISPLIGGKFSKLSNSNPSPSGRLGLPRTFSFTSFFGSASRKTSVAELTQQEREEAARALIINGLLEGPDEEILKLPRTSTMGSIFGGGGENSRRNTRSESISLAISEHMLEQDIDPDDSGDEDELNMFIHAPRVSSPSGRKTGSVHYPQTKKHLT